MPGSWREVAIPRMLVRLSRPQRLARNLRLTALFELLARVTRIDGVLELRDGIKAVTQVLNLIPLLLAC